MSGPFARLGRETVVYGLGELLNRVAGLLLLPLFTRAFRPAEYGVLDAITTMVSLASVLLAAGTETALGYYYYRSEDPAHRRRTVTAAATYVVGINALVAAVVWLGADWIVRAAFRRPDVAAYLRLAVLALPFSSIVTLNLNVLRLERRPWRCLGLSLPQALLALTLNLVLVGVLRVGVIGVFWSNVATVVIIATVGTVLNRSFYAGAVDVGRMRELLAYGLPLAVGGLSLWSISYLDRFFLLRQVPLDQLGVYAVAVKLGGAMALATQAFRTANAPFQFQAATEAGAEDLYRRTLSYYLLGAMLVAVPLALFARPALQVFTTAAYVDGYRFVPLVAFGLVAHGAYQLGGVGLVLTKHTGRMGAALMAGAAANAVYLWYLVPRFGALGAALASLGARLTVVTLLFVLGQRCYPVRYDLARAARIIGVAGLVVMAGFLLGPRTFWGDTLLGLLLVVAFLVSIPVLALLDRQELAALHGRLLALVPRR